MRPDQYIQSKQQNGVRIFPGCYSATLLSKIEDNSDRLTVA